MKGADIDEENRLVSVASGYFERRIFLSSISFPNLQVLLTGSFDQVISAFDMITEVILTFMPVIYYGALHPICSILVFAAGQ